MDGYGMKRLNPLRPRKNGRHFADDTLNRIFLNEIVRISIKISMKFVPKGPINNIPSLVQIMAWRRPGDKPLSEPMMVRLPTHICVTRPQRVKRSCDVALMYYLIDWFRLTLTIISTHTRQHLPSWHAIVVWYSTYIAQQGGKVWYLLILWTR